MELRVVLLLVVLATLFQASYQSTYGTNVVSRPSLYTSGGPHVSTTSAGIIRDNDWHKRCIGTLISNRVILTSAHCVDCETAEVILGFFDILVYEKTQIRIYITRADIIFHPGYDYRTLDDDLALIILPYKIDLNRFISTAKLVDADFHAGFGTKAHVTGWQKLPFGYSNVLSQLDVSIISEDKCASFWPTARINDKKICASNVREAHASYLLGSDCIAESGAPLTLYDHPDVVFGILTSSAKCGSLLPEVFTDIAKYRYWIDEILASLEIEVVIVVDTDVTVVETTVTEEVTALEVLTVTDTDEQSY